MVFSDRCPVVHGVERRDLVHTHGGHLEEARDLVHDADAAEAVLALAEVEERHDGGLLVLRGVPRDNLLDELLILRGELERDRRVVLGRVAVLGAPSAAQLHVCRRRRATHHLQGVAARGGCDAESPPLGPLELAQGAGPAAIHEGYQLGGHCGCACGFPVVMSSMKDVEAAETLLGTASDSDQSEQFGFSLH